MKFPSGALRILTVVAAVFLSQPVFADVIAEEEADIASLNNLVLIDKDSRGELYANPNVDWNVYTEIQLEDATVAFRRNWQRDQNRYDPFKVKAEDMERIKSGLSELFREVFTEELVQKGDYTIVGGTGPNILTIKPAIVDLDIAAPDTRQPGITRSYTESSGRMTLKLELYDSMTGELLATASDRQTSPYHGYLQWTTSVSNRADARRMLQRWADALSNRLDEARISSAPASE